MIKKEIKNIIDKIINVFTCIDGRSFLLNDREDLVKGRKIVFNVMTKWDLIVNTGHEGKK